MIRASALLVGLFVAAPMAAAEPASLSVSAEAPNEVLAPPAAVVLKEEGFSYAIGITALSVFNGSPLSYSPLELGWRFDNGVRLRGGIDLFYYEGQDTDAKKPERGQQLYSYEMMDLRALLLYAVPLPGRVRPVAGLSLELLRGNRKLAGGVLNAPNEEGWGFLGSGAVLGGEWRVNENLALELLARYTLSFGNYGALTGVGVDTAFLF